MHFLDYETCGTAFEMWVITDFVQKVQIIYMV